MNIRKIIFAIVLLTCATTYAQAQLKWSAGLRTGLELVNYQLTHEDFKGENRVWHNQLFLNKKVGNRFEIEATLFNTNKNYLSTSTFSSSERDSAVTQVKQSKIGLSIAGKYSILKKSAWILYAQLGFTFVKMSDHYNISTYKQGAILQHSSVTENNSSLFDRTFGGLVFDYNLTKRLHLTSNLNVYYKIDGITYPGNAYYNKWAANVLLGAGFRI